MRAPRRRLPETPFTAYLRELAATPLLTAEEEKSLAHRIAAGDTVARRHFIQANLRLAVNIARRYLHRGLAFEDLVSEGNTGVIRAVDLFDPNLNTRFSRYASYWIKRAIETALVKYSKTIGIPVYIADTLGRWHQATADLQRELGRPPNHHEIATRLGIGAERAKSVIAAIRAQELSVVSDRNEDGAMADVLLDRQAPAPDARLAVADDIGRLVDAMAMLDAREQMVIRGRFGFDGQRATLATISEKIGLTMERVRQIERDAVAKMGAILTRCRERRGS